MNEMENLGDGLRNEIARVCTLAYEASERTNTLVKDIWHAEESVRNGDVVKMHMMYEKLKTWK